MTYYITDPKLKKQRINEQIPHPKDIFITRCPVNAQPSPHSHNYFEINYVEEGSCKFIFEKDSRTLARGELCIIAPFSEHDIVSDSESEVFSIILKKNSFNSSLRSLMAEDNPLSSFFRRALNNDPRSGYLLFHTGNTGQIRHIITNAMEECRRNDDYSSPCCQSWITLLFSNLLRNHNVTVHFKGSRTDSDLPLILQYIQRNYRDITLSSLSKMFHYSEPHLSALIRQNTGHTFTDLVKTLRLSQAAYFLVNTDLKISEIAEKTGYHSADHFSRMFRSIYHMPPQKYRKENSTLTNKFISVCTEGHHL